MGDRGQVKILPDGVYLYTHWNAEELEDTVKKAMKRQLRWDDSEYLARIIFCAMLKGHDQDGETGFGIGTGEHGDIWRLITVDCEAQTVTVADLYKKTTKTNSFNDFIGEG